MKNKIKLFSLIALVALVGFTLITCSSGGAGGGGGGGGGKSSSSKTPAPTWTYIGGAGSDTYVLEIKGKSGDKAPTAGNTFKLMVNPTCTGTITENSGGKLKLKPSKSGASEFTTTVSSQGITAMSDTITFDDGSTRKAPDKITPRTGGTLTITGIPSDITNYFWGNVNITSGFDIVFTAEQPSSPNDIKGKKASGGTVTLNVYTLRWDPTSNTDIIVPFTGTVTRNKSNYFEIFISSTEKSDWGDKNIKHTYLPKGNVQFKDGSATIKWTDLEEEK